jgi:UDP-N-acetyl-D-glucosamine dehydrogenase
MPHFVADKVAEALNTHRKAVNGSSVLVLGIAYKRDIDDIRESPALDVMHVLQQRGARVSYSDPHAPLLRARDWPGGAELTSVGLTRDELARHDCVVVVTDHTAFDYGLVVEAAALVVDTRNATNGGANVFRLGAPRAQQESEATARDSVLSGA